MSDQGLSVRLSAAQREQRSRYSRFVDEQIAPHAAEWDRIGALPLEVRDLLRAHGFLGSILPQEDGSGGLEPLLYGLLTEELGRACSSTRSLLTVHDMTALAVWRWGQSTLEPELLRQIAAGQKLAAFAVSEAEAGSDLSAVQTTARFSGREVVLDGKKEWVTFGQLADVFLVLARSEGRAGDGELVALLVESNAPGLFRAPTNSIVGTRASRMAEIVFRGCRLPEHAIVGRVGAGLSHVVATALDLGRFSVAWGSVGIARACTETALAHTRERVQFGRTLSENQLVRRKLTEMITSTQAARLLCCRAATLRQEGDPAAVSETLIAKYAASRAAVAAAGAAVQLLGAKGLCSDFPAERYLRDAKVTEIIEGSSQLQQDLIPQLPLPDL